LGLISLGGLIFFSLLLRVAPCFSDVARCPDVPITRCSDHQITRSLKIGFKPAYGFLTFAVATPTLSSGSYPLCGLVMECKLPMEDE
jgi:hypothetical protein